MSTAVAAGSALGSAAGGVLIDSHGVHAAFAFAAISCGLGAAAVTSTRRSLIAVGASGTRG
jgi:predicted MFS family arabinose efflux permease